MKHEDFIGYLGKNPERYVWEYGEHQGKEGLFVADKMLETETFFSKSAIDNNDLDTLVSAMHQGRNVENITRVTGFFSKIKGWNRGKIGELKQRHKSEME